jgi:hypothetical protein
VHLCWRQGVLGTASGWGRETISPDARNYGNLNCNAITSTYELRGSIDADGGVVGGTITVTRPNE